MTTPSPPIAVFAAWTRLRDSTEGRFESDGWVYDLDGPQMCPVELMFPSAQHIETGQVWFPYGDEDEPITEFTKWLDPVTLEQV